MLSHDTAIAPEISTAILAAIGIAPLGSQPLVHAGLVNRELKLSVSDGFSRQTWEQEGEVRHEARDTLLLDQNEHIRITVTNDMPGVRVVSVGDGRLLRIRPGESASMDVGARSTGGFTIAVVGEPAVSRQVYVRARRRAGARAA